MNEENETDLKELMHALSQKSLEDIVIHLHRNSCRKHIKNLTLKELIETAQEISDISMEYPIHLMTRGNSKKRWKLKKFPDLEFSGIELTAWLFEICDNIAKKMDIEPPFKINFQLKRSYKHDTHKGCNKK